MISGRRGRERVKKAMVVAEPAIVRMPRITDAVLVDDQRTDLAAELKQGVPIPSVARVRERTRWLMRKLGLWAVRPKRNTSQRHPEHKVYPYLLRGKTIEQPNQVWAADITYIPMRQGFCTWSRSSTGQPGGLLSWRLSNTLTAGFCVEALSEALGRFGKPGIFNADQGAQFTSDEFTKMLRDHRIEISMDGRGRCHDNIFVERLWWTVKRLRPAANGIEQKNRSAALASSSTGTTTHRNTHLSMWHRQLGICSRLSRKCAMS